MEIFKFREKPKVKASISSVAAAKTLPFLQSSAHWASASQGA